MKYKINEIFYSIQGEGFNTGMPAVFIRFADCNLKCSFCDTDYSKKMELTKDEIVEKVKRYNCDNIIFTGGEPILQDLETLANSFFHLNWMYRIFIETNGTVQIPNYFYNNFWITVSPKNFKDWQLRKGNELKLVYTNQSENELYDYRIRSDFDHYYLQPCDGMNNLKKVIEIVKKNNEWSLSCQMQKLINIK